MNLEILIVFSILISALVLFFTGWIRMDIVALLVLGSLAVSGLITPQEALSGFSNPAVVTVWAMFIISAALYQTGVAKIIGRQVLRLAGGSEWRMIIVIMFTTGILSAVMNNIGVAVLMLPVVMDISRTTGRPASRLLMPLAYSSLLGGLTTLIGTPPNLLVSFALQDAGLQPFGLFDFTPVGMGVMLGGILFVAFLGRHILPSEQSNGKPDRKSKKELTASYHLQERTFMMHIKENSNLLGKTLAECRLRAALGVNVLSVKRHGGGTILDPGPDTLLRANDKLFVQGRFDAIKALKQWKILLPEQTGISPEHISLSDLGFFEGYISNDSLIIEKSIREIKHKTLQEINILAIKRDDQVMTRNINQHTIIDHDIFLCQGSKEKMEELVAEGVFKSYIPVAQQDLIENYRLHETVFIMEIIADPEITDQNSDTTQLGEAFGLSILGLVKSDGKIEKISSGKKFNIGDHLLVKGSKKELPILQGLIGIELLEEKAPGTQSLQAENVMMAEVVLAPRSLLPGKTLREINFRKKYGLTVLALWREGRAYRTNLHNLSLRFGEALLLYGKREKIELIGNEPDFILLTDTMPQQFRTHKALTAVLILLGVLLPVLLGFIPLAISAIIGIAFLVLSGCLKMEEAYRAIEWRSVFLIAGMLPLGFAMQKSGAAEMMAQAVINIAGSYGPWGIFVGLYLLTLISTLAIPPAALVVIMSPIVIQAAENFGISPYSLMMGMAIAAAASFLSPISHPANLLVMGPGGYKFTDYIKLGLPLSLVVMAIVMLLLPIIWPF